METKSRSLQVKDMYELKNDELDKILEKEEPEGVEFFLMADERPYNGIESHRAAILFAMHLVNENEKQTIKKAEELFGKEYADRLHLFTYDISKAEAKSRSVTTNSGKLDLMLKYKQIQSNLIQDVVDNLEHLFLMIY